MTNPRRRPTAARAAPKARPRPALEGLRAPPRLGWLVGAVALAALLFACRGAPLGVPAADDYDYLYTLRFEHPLDFWGPMGSDWYWRPLSRQLYFLAVGPGLFPAPWLVPVLHGALLAILFALVYRTARRTLDPWTAAAVAAFPMLALPSRALLAWPTGAQPLLGMVGIALAVHEAAARRAGTALVALLAALLSHAQAVLAVPLVPIVFAFATRDRGKSTRFALAVAAVALAFAAASLVAQRHGAGLPPRATLGEAAAALPDLLLRSLRIQFNLDELTPAARLPVGLAEAALALLALAALTRRAPRARLAAHLPAVLLGAVWFVVGVALLAFAPELFTPRHTCIPSLGLALVTAVVLGAAAPALAALSIGVRLLALVLAPAAPATLAVDIPGGSAKMSFQEIVRLQRTADSARRALLAAYPTLPPETVVRYWSLPRSSQVAFDGERAVRVWYADSTLSWEFWDRARAVPEANPAPTLAFNLAGKDPAVVMRPLALQRYEAGMAALSGGTLRDADRAFAAADSAQAPRVLNFTAEITRLRARLALERGDRALAESLNEEDRALAGEGASYHELRAVLAWRGGRREEARAEALRTLDFMPGNVYARAILDTLRMGLRPPAAPALPEPPRPMRPEAGPARGSPPGR